MSIRRNALIERDERPLWLALANLALPVITAPSLRLDLETARQRRGEAIAKLKRHLAEPQSRLDERFTTVLLGSMAGCRLRCWAAAASRRHERTRAGRTWGC